MLAALLAGILAGLVTGLLHTVYYLVVIVVLWLKFNSNDLKLFTALIVALFLAVPYLKEQSRSSFRALKRREDSKNA